MTNNTQTMINGVDTNAVNETIEGIRQDPTLGRCEFRLRNEWISGDANRSSVRDFYAAGEEQQHKRTFHFRAGEPELLAGKDEGANPVEFLLSALSSCVTSVIAYYSALNGFTIEKMESTYTGDLDMQGLFGLDENVRPGYQNIRIHFKIKTDAPKEMLESFVPFSPVHDVVSRSVPVQTVIETY